MNGRRGARDGQSGRNLATNRVSKSVCNCGQGADRQVLAPVVVVACRRKLVPWQNNSHAAAQCPPAGSTLCHHTHFLHYLHFPAG